MSARAGLVLGLLCVCGAAWGQDAPPPKPRAIQAADPVGGRAALDASLATVAARGMGRTERQPSREELIDILLFMSLRSSKAHGA
jgi:hypothetical protein